MKISRIISATLFFLCAALVISALTCGPTVVENWRDPRRPTLYYEVPSKTPLEFVVVPKTTQLKISSRILIEPTRAWKESEPRDYRLRIEWIDPKSVVVKEKILAESSRISWFPTDDVNPIRNASVLADNRWVTDGRNTFIPIAEFLPGGGAVRITPLTDRDESVLLRAFGKRERRALALERSLVVPTRRETTRAEEHSGLPAWELLTDRERRALLSSSWRVLEAKRPPNDLLISRKVLSSTGFELRWEDRRLGPIQLEPGRRAALNFVGDVRIRLSGDRTLSAIRLSLVADLPSGNVAPTLDDAPAEPVPFPSVTHGRRITVKTETAYSLILENTDSSQTTLLYATLEDPKSGSLFGYPTAARLSEIVNSGVLHRDDLALLGPEFRVFPTYIIGEANSKAVLMDVAGLGKQSSVRFTIRTVAGDRQAHASVPPTVVVEGLSKDGAVIRRHSGTVRAPLSSFESARKIFGDTNPSPEETDILASQWISEPVHLYLAGEPNVTQLRLSASAPLLVNISGRTPLHGDERAYGLPYDSMHVRYRRDSLSNWGGLRASNDPELLSAGQWGKITAQVRLSADGDDDNRPGGGTQRSYSSLHVQGSRKNERLWLIPEGKLSSRARSVWCPTAAGQTASFLRSDATASALGGLLTGFVWSPSAGLGESFALDLGSQTIAARVRQQLTRLTPTRVGALTHVAFEGPPGSTLWLKNSGSGSTPLCAHPHRAISAMPLAPNATLNWRATKGAGPHVVILGGLATRAPLLTVRIDRGILARAPGLSADYTLSTRQMTLERSDRVARAMDAPETLLPVLATHGIKLGSDIPPGGHDIEVHNDGDEVLWIWAAQQSAQPGEPPITLPRWTEDERSFTP